MRELRIAESLRCGSATRKTLQDINYELPRTRLDILPAPGYYLKVVTSIRGAPGLSASTGANTSRLMTERNRVPPTNAPDSTRVKKMLRDFSGNAA